MTTVPRRSYLLVDRFHIIELAQSLWASGLGATFGKKDREFVLIDLPLSESWSVGEMWSLSRQVFMVVRPSVVVVFKANQVEISR